SCVTRASATTLPSLPQTRGHGPNSQLELEALLVLGLIQPNFVGVVLGAQARGKRDPDRRLFAIQLLERNTEPVAAAQGRLAALEEHVLEVHAGALLAAPRAVPPLDQTTLGDAPGFNKLSVGVCHVEVDVCTRAVPRDHELHDAARRAATFVQRSVAIVVERVETDLDVAGQARLDRADLRPFGHARGIEPCLPG